MELMNAGLQTLAQALNEVRDLPGVKFGYAVVRNRQKVTAELRRIYRLRENIEGQVEFEKARQELCEAHCDRSVEEGSAGEPVIVEGSYVGLDNNPDFEKGLEDLKKAHPEFMEKMKKAEEAFHAEMMSLVSIKLYKVRMDVVPEEVTARQLEGLVPIIEDWETWIELDEPETPVVSE